MRMYAYGKAIIVAKDAEQAVTLLKKEGHQVHDEKIEKIGPNENLKILEEDDPGSPFEIQKASYWIEELGHGVHGDP